MSSTRESTPSDNGAPQPRRTTRKPQPKPLPIQALGDIPGFPARDEPVLNHISCKQVCESYPNHIRNEMLDCFLHYSWSASQIYDALAPEAKAFMTSQHAKGKDSRSKYNVIAKRLEKRRARYEGAGALDTLKNAKNMRPEGMGDRFRGAARTALRKRGQAAASRDNTPARNVSVPATPVPARAGPATTEDPGDHNNYFATPLAEAANGGIYHNDYFVTPPAEVAGGGVFVQEPMSRDPSTPQQVINDFDLFFDESTSALNADPYNLDSTMPPPAYGYFPLTPGPYDSCETSYAVQTAGPAASVTPLGGYHYPDPTENQLQTYFDLEEHLGYLQSDSCDDSSYDNKGESDGYEEY